MPSTSDVVPLLGLLDLLPVRDDRVGASSASTSPNTCGWRRTSLSWTPRGDVGDRERARLGREHRVDHHLEQQVAELVLERVVRARRDVAAGRVGRELVDRLHDLVRLFEHVAAQRVVRLRGVPRAAARAAQPLGQRDAGARARPATATLAGVDEQRREVVGLDARSRSASATVNDAARRAGRGAAAR